MTVILFKTYLCFAVVLLVNGFTELWTIGKYAEYFCAFVMISCTILFIATICSFIWFF